MISGVWAVSEHGNDRVLSLSPCQDLKISGAAQNRTPHGLQMISLDSKRATLDIGLSLNELRGYAFISFTAHMCEPRL